MRVTYSEFRQRMTGLMDEVVASGAPLLVTQQGRKNVVLLSEEEFAGWEETVHLLRNSANAVRLMESVAQADAGATEARDLIDR